MLLLLVFRLKVSWTVKAIFARALVLFAVKLK